MKAYRPDVVAAAAYCKKSVVICVRIRAWNHGPRAPVPMERQRLRGDEGTVKPHSPNIVAAAAYSYKSIILCANIRTWHHGPCAPIPVQSERLKEAAARNIQSDSPNVVAAACYGVEVICVCPNIRTGDYVPTTDFTLFFLHDLEIFDGHVGRRDARERKEYC